MPEEMLQKILSYIRLPQDILNTSLTCHSFYYSMLCLVKERFVNDAISRIENIVPRYIYPNSRELLISFMQDKARKGFIAEAENFKAIKAFDRSLKKELNSLHYNLKITVFPKEAWLALGLEVVDKEALTIPKFNWSTTDPYFNKPFSENYVLLYIPKCIRIVATGKERQLTLDVLLEAGKQFLSYLAFGEDCFPRKDLFVKDLFGSSTDEGGWVLISKREIPKSIEKFYLQQKKMIQDKSSVFRMPSIMEAIGVNVLHAASNGTKLYKEKHYTRCLEIFRRRDHVCSFLVGGFDSEGLDIRWSFTTSAMTCWGVAVVQRL